MDAGARPPVYAELLEISEHDAMERGTALGGQPVDAQETLYGILP